MMNSLLKTQQYAQLVRLAQGTGARPFSEIGTGLHVVEVMKLMETIADIFLCSGSGRMT